MKTKSNILLTVIAFVIFAIKPLYIEAQVTLDANGPGQTYELINSKLAPGYTAVESPDQCASHPSFGRHIAEVFDATLNKYVFEFYIHVPTTFPVTATTADNDRCQSFDRQRVEIKTYESSPANLKGTLGETVTYKWKFKLPFGFQPSPNFTHIHQVKAVGGDDGDPLFTLTVRSGSTNVLQLLHVVDSTTPATVLSVVNLSSIAGTWIDVVETIKVGSGVNGTYSINLKKESDGTNLLSYSNSVIATIRSSNTFIRPKWGIYRSLNNYSFLRDDSIRIASISIQEGVLPVTLKAFTASVKDDKVRLSWQVENEINLKNYAVETSSNAKDFNIIATVQAKKLSSYHYDFIPNEKQFYVRLKMLDKDGAIQFSEVKKVVYNELRFDVKVYPNPTYDILNVVINNLVEANTINIINRFGVVVATKKTNNKQSQILTNNLSNGQYTLQILNSKNEVQHATSIIINRTKK
ncbi:MAG: T9SS type A sorting domain-containing protein [Chitinophagaceae bacterium]